MLRDKQELEALNKCKQLLDLVEPHPDYKNPNNPTRGKCYCASIALYVYLGGSKNGYHLTKAEDEVGSHYWVETPNKKILDPTKEQFDSMGKTPPYTLGKHISFRGNYKKHLPLLDRMRTFDEDKPD